jgi:hypothetical protein
VAWPHSLSALTSYETFCSGRWQGHNMGDDPVRATLKTLAEVQDLARLRDLVGPHDKGALHEALQTRLEALNASVQKLRL